MEHANAQHDNIQFTCPLGISVNLLDTTVSLTKNGISTDLYTKPTDTHQYLLPSSNHPPHVHAHLPYGLAICLRAIVSDEVRLKKSIAELTGFLTTRGYSERLVNQQLAKALAKPREDVLQSAEKAKTNRTPLVCTWDTCLPPLQAILKMAYPILCSNERLKKLFELLLC